MEIMSEREAVSRELLIDIRRGKEGDILRVEIEASFVLQNIQNFYYSDNQGLFLAVVKGKIF